MDRHSTSSDLTTRDDRSAGGAGSAFISSREAILRREIGRLLGERTSLRQDNAALRQANDRLTAQIKDRESTLACLQSQLARALEQRKHDRAILQALYGSHSWILTRPLRRLSRLVRSAPAAFSLTDLPLLDHETAPLPAAAPSAVAAPPAASPAPRAALRGHLFIAADLPPLYDQHSGGLRLITLIGMLHDDGWSLTFGSLLGREALPGAIATPQGLAKYEGRLREAGVETLLYGIPEIDAYLFDRSTLLDWAFLSFPAVAREVLPLVRCRFPQARIVYDMVDFHGLRGLREAERLGDAARIPEARRMREEEIGLARAADVTLAITPEEKASILAAAPQAVVKVLPNVFDLPPRTHPPLADRHGLFFIGGFWHRPNSDGIRWFVDAILPLIRAELPEVGLTIAGSNMDDAILALGARPGVTVAGFVPELQPVFDRHRVFVAPLRFGAGMKGKVAQSLLHGLPAVATGIGAEGMGLVHGTHILVAEEAADFAQEVVSLLRDDALWERLAARGRQHIETTLSREAVKPQLEAVFRG